MKRELKEIAHEAIVIDKDRRLSYAVEEMEKNNIARLPVTEEGELVGIITERDIVEKIGSSRSLNMRTSSFHVSSCMTSDPFSLSEDAKVIEALLAFKERGISGIPVLGEKIGIVTKTDLLKAFDFEGYVSEHMNTKFHALSPDDRVIHARRIMLDNDIHSLPVWDGEAVGIVTIQDILIGLNLFREKTPGRYMDNRLKEFTVDQVMTTEVEVASLEETLNDVKRRLVEHNFSSMPVTNYEDNIVGMISKDELINAL
ncbi:CBS domain-containing protein [archaeon]|nr:MAG: CBS domain-containing protein [archaeon]